MGSEAGGYTDNVKATREQIIAALQDFETYTEWQGGMLEVTVKEKDDQGRGTLVEMYVDAKVRKVRYLCRYNWDMPGGGIGWDYVSGDLKDNQGRYTFVEREDGTTDVTVDIVFEIGFFVPGPMKT